MQISATIITLNEERNIARAIESLRCCDEILILDSGSTDRTVELARDMGLTVIVHPENRGYGVALRSGFAAARATCAGAGRSCRRTDPNRPQRLRWSRLFCHSEFAKNPDPVPRPRPCHVRQRGV